MGEDSSDPGTIVQTTTPDWKQQERTEAARAYLLVFEAESSRIVELPMAGELAIGRDKSCHLMLKDHSVSRRHAVITVGPEQTFVRDLDSQNGTVVNAEKIVGQQALVSGDTIEIGNATLIVQRQRDASARRALLDLVAFRQRAEEEIDRALRFHRPLSIMSIVLPGADPLAEASQLRDTLRMIDIVARDGTKRLAVIMPETSRDEAITATDRLLEAVEGSLRTIRIGVAAYPADGCDADTLLASARTASRIAPEGEAACLDGLARTLEVGPHTVIIADPGMLRCYELIERLAKSRLPVLICGETGTGKEAAAAVVHYHSPRSGGPFVVINCAALPDSLIESELFGHERGAFTDATTTKQGSLERADGGTVFLDEIAELSAAAQAKLLRVLETHRVMRLGAVSEREVDIRIVAATHRNLEEAVVTGTFRQDLFFRLSGCTITLPPLRDRPREIALLAERFLSDTTTGEPKVLSDDALRALVNHPWPGNVRELKNLIGYLAATIEEQVIEAIHFRDRIDLRGVTSLPVAGRSNAPGEFRAIADEIRELEIARMRGALDAAGGNQTRAAALIKMPLRTFQAKAKQYNLTAPSRRPTEQA